MAATTLSRPETVSRMERMAELIGVLAPAEGYTMSALDEVKFLRANHSLPRTPVLYEPCIIFVCKGRKRGYFADQVYLYDTQHFLVLSLPLPLESETEASPEEPMLAISIRIDLSTLAELALAMGQPASPDDADVVGISSTPIDDKLGDAVVRLLEVLACPVEASVLGQPIIREIYFRVMTGAQGAAIRAALTHQSHFARIGKALRLIHAHFDADLDVDTLAEAANMSVAAFHAGFKTVTGTSPIQYLKATRLHKARILMIQEGFNASVAASKVGYESPSQFSREFKRFFGRTPVDEANFMKDAMALRLRVQPPEARAQA
ncbi:AraC family transcriptional regulator [Cupriavidus sp. CV2]|uniref:AraC family transcriptional regulator n=1 Tax=Cupriavidus ulmosensis TaxID=3065913 RepID=UPI00296AB5CB|nr:AraC family transcriptional regulator [Cupriavidus sp. CV2]MDW3686260.1 AraC family transcriptional regulator [Cupriavidus sp. CV2]